MLIDEKPKQVGFTNSFQAGILVKGDNFLPYVLAGGFTVTCPFSGTVLNAQLTENYVFGRNELPVPGPTNSSLGTYQLDGFDEIPGNRCRVCTMNYRGAITAASIPVLKGEGGSISFAGGELTRDLPLTFQMCAAGAGGGGDAGCN